MCIYDLYVHLTFCIMRKQRVMRSIQLLNSTGTEFQEWLLWYSLPILKGILPELYYSHYAGLVAGVGFLLQVPVSRVNFQTAETFSFMIFVANSLIYMEGCNGALV